MRLCRGKRPRGARPSQVVVALFLELTMAQCAILRQWARHGFFSIGCRGARSMQSAAKKQAFVEQDFVGQPHEGSGPSARAF